MLKHYKAYEKDDGTKVNFLSETAVANVMDLEGIDNKCHAGSKKEHTHYYAYNLCKCIDCKVLTNAEPAFCKPDNYCEADYDYRKHDVEYDCGSTTYTTTSMREPPTNCPSPVKPVTCHFWGDPHFTHLFSWAHEGVEKIAEGGRHTHATAGNPEDWLFDFNPSGVFQLASSRDGHFEAQAFFCPFAEETTTGVGVATRIGTDVIHVMRGEATKPTSDSNRGRGAQKYYADLTENPEANFTDFYLNGRKVPWEELGFATGTRGSDVKQGPNGRWGGATSGHAFMQQMKTRNPMELHWVHDHLVDENGAENSQHLSEDDLAVLPACVGDSVVGDSVNQRVTNNLLEVAAPYVTHSLGQYNAYEHSLTIRMKAPWYSDSLAGYGVIKKD